MPTGIYFRTRETREILSLAAHTRIRAPHSEETCKRIGDAQRGKKRKALLKESIIKRTETRRKNGWMKNPESTRLKMSINNARAMEGRVAWNKGLIGYGAKENHWNWKGGKTPEVYPKEFNASLKLKIRERDKFICCRCGKTEKDQLEKIGRVLSVNHINYDKKDCSEKNLNTLCVGCNTQVNKDRGKWTIHFQEMIEKIYDNKILNNA